MTTVRLRGQHDGGNTPPPPPPPVVKGRAA